MFQYQAQVLGSSKQSFGPTSLFVKGFWGAGMRLDGGSKPKGKETEDLLKEAKRFGWNPGSEYGYSTT